MEMLVLKNTWQTGGVIIEAWEKIPWYVEKNWMLIESRAASGTQNKVFLYEELLVDIRKSGVSGD